MNGALTGGRINVLGLELAEEDSKSVQKGVCLVPRHGMKERRGEKPSRKLTWPAMEPSWEDLPLTVKVTPLGALDLTSRDAADELAEALGVVGG